MSALDTLPTIVAPQCPNCGEDMKGEVHLFLSAPRLVQMMMPQCIRISGLARKSDAPER